MRAYVGFLKCKIKIEVDCITLQSTDGEECLDLSFSEQDMCYDKSSADLRLKSEEPATFGLPKSLEGCFGNNEKTYKFIRESELASIVLYTNSDNETLVHKPKLKYLMIEIGNKKIYFRKSKLNKCEIEFNNN